jgi:hypothetical protein
MRRLDGLLVLLVLLVFHVLFLSILSLLIRILVVGPLQPSSLAKILTLTLSDECLVRVRDRVYR